MNFVDVGGGMKVVGVGEGPSELLGEQAADCCFARADHSHDNHDHWLSVSSVELSSPAGAKAPTSVRPNGAAGSRALSKPLGPIGAILAELLLGVRFLLAGARVCDRECAVRFGCDFDQLSFAILFHVGDVRIVNVVVAIRTGRVVKLPQVFESR